MPRPTQTRDLAHRLHPRLSLAMIVRMVQATTTRAALAARR